MTIAVTADDVRIVSKVWFSFRGTANATLTAGDVVYHDGTGFGVADDDASVATANCVGMAMQDASSGDEIDVLVLGEVTGWTGLTAGNIAYVVDDGKVAASAGTKNFAVGFMLTTTNILVNPFSPVA